MFTKAQSGYIQYPSFTLLPKIWSKVNLRVQKGSPKTLSRWMCPLVMVFPLQEYTYSQIKLAGH